MEGVLFAWDGCLSAGVTVEHCLMVTTDLEGTAAVSKSAMVVGGFWTISTQVAID